MTDIPLRPLRSEAFHRDPFPVYKVLRDEHPVFFDTDRGAYVLTRFADVREAARDHQRFSSAANRLEVFDRITRRTHPSTTCGARCCRPASARGG